MGREETDALASRIRTFETAYGMQSLMPEITDVSKETDSTTNSISFDIRLP